MFQSWASVQTRNSSTHLYVEERRYKYTTLSWTALATVLKVFFFALGASKILR